MTRTRILQAALQRFSSGDYSETSLKDIAGDVGIKAPSIYAHFANKEQLYTEVYERSIADHSEFFRARIAEVAHREPIERLRHILLGVPDFYRDRPELFELHLRTALSHNLARERGMAEAFQVWDTELSAAVSEAYLAGVATGQLTSVPPEAFTSHFLALMDGIFLQKAYYPPAVYEVHATQTWEVLERFLTPAAAQETTS
ncbi:TetR/AcrR family transcriptional regulator [Leucobacter komagatae]|uniref:TetR/AcrR family transcriptional regulator n=1 Tax=Leucobacter komagatae TaxID=55969 RepID=UPI000698E989|nr:TetR/AcrR family transcriptional regulator [Leucobacter komagatae]